MLLIYIFITNCMKGKLTVQATYSLKCTLARQDYKCNAPKMSDKVKNASAFTQSVSNVTCWLISGKFRRFLNIVFDLLTIGFWACFSLPLLLMTNPSLVHYDFALDQVSITRLATWCCVWTSSRQTLPPEFGKNTLRRRSEPETRYDFSMYADFLVFVLFSVFSFTSSSSSQ